MRKPFLYKVITAIWLLGMGIVVCSADDFQPMAVTQANPSSLQQTSAVQNAGLADLQSELAALREQVNRLSGGKQVSWSPGEWATPCPGCSNQACPHCNCDEEAGFYAGYSFLFAKPQMKESFQATVLHAPTGTSHLIPFSTDYDLTPRIWFGFQTEDGPGLRARYWQYDHEANTFSQRATFTSFPGATATTVIFPAVISTAAPGDLLNVRSGLEVHTTDLEGTIAHTLGRTELLVGGGIRHASMNQHYSAQVTRMGALLGDITWDRKFEGTGLILSGDARHPLGDNGFAVVGNVRGSLLFGEKTINRRVIGDLTPTPGAPIISFQDADEVTGIFEAAIGAEWSGQIGKSTEVFLRALYETQLWTAAGAPTLTFLGFEGLSLALGFDR